jgi:YVTN family beta-propeller protein
MKTGIFVLAIALALIALSQAGQAAVVKKAYVACGGSDNVWVRNLGDGSYLTPIPVGGQPADIAIDHTASFIYVLNYESCSVSIIRTATDTVDASLAINLTYNDIPYHPLRIVLDPQREYAFVIAERSFQSDEGCVFVINTNLIGTSVRAVCREIPTSGNVRGLAVTHSGSNYLVMVHYLDNVMDVYDADTYQRVDSYNPLAEDGKINLTYRRAGVGDMPPADKCVDAVFTPSGDKLYIAHEHYVSMINVTDMVDGGLLTNCLSDADFQVDFAQALAANPINGQVFATSGSMRQVTQINGSAVAANVFVGEYPGKMAIDGNTLYVCNEQSNSVSVIDIDRRVVQSAFSTGKTPRGIAVAAVTVPDPTPAPTPPPTPTPTPGPRPLNVNVTVSPNPVSLGTETSVTISVTSNDTPVSGASVIVSCPTGQVVMLNSITAADGKCYAKLIPANAGIAMLTATVSGSSYQPASANVPVQISPVAVYPMSVNIVVSPQPVLTGSDAVVMVTVLNGSAPVGGASINLVTQGGAITPSSGLTTTDGRFLARFTSAIPGSYFMTASASAGGFQAATSSAPIAVAKAPPKRLYMNVSVEPDVIDVRTGGTITVEVTDGNSPVSGSGVSIACIGANVSPASGATGSNGKFSARFMPEDTGAFTLNVVAMAGGFDQASANVLVDVTRSMDAATLIFLVVLALAIVAVILLGIIFFLRRWFSSELQVVLKKTRIPADPAVRVPLRVMFTNGFRIPRKMPRDTDVEFETTGGAVRDVTINAGRDSATTEVTASREFGPVTITARAGGRTATTRAEFVVVNGTLEMAATPASIPADGRSSATIVIKVKDGAGNYLKPLEDTVIELGTTLGDVISSVTMGAGSQSATATIMSGDMTGVAMIAASMGDMRGEARLEFEGLPKRFCMHCGSQMTMEAAFCPACSQTPPSGVDTKQCPTCGTVIPEKAQFCYKCGAMQAVPGQLKKTKEVAG